MDYKKAKKLMDEAYGLLSKITVSEQGVDLMYIAKAKLREAYAVLNEPENGAVLNEPENGMEMILNGRQNHRGTSSCTNSK